MKGTLTVLLILALGCLIPGFAIAEDVTANQSQQTLQMQQICIPGAVMDGGMMSPEIMQMADRMQPLSSLQLDQSFIETMLHQNAGTIRMSEIARDRAMNPQLRQYAIDVADMRSQQNEQLAGWLGRWYGTSIRANRFPSDERMVDRFWHIGGMDFETTYMRQMITQNDEAIALAQIARARASHPDLVIMATDIINQQSCENMQLRAWLAEWYNITE